MASRKLRRSEEGLILLGLGLGGVFAVVVFFNSRLYFVVDTDRYLVLHTLMELASILVSFAVFIVNWEASKLSRNAQSLFVATGFLAVAALSTMHTLSYQGMPSFVTPNSVGKAIYYWFSSNLWAAAVLWAAAYVRPNTSGPFLRRYLLAAANLLVALLVFVAVTLFGPRLPTMFVEGEGLTPLKISLEYLAIGLSLGAMLAHMRLYGSTRDDALVLVIAALIANIFAGLAFTFYLSPYDVYNLLGHLYKVISYYLIFRALLVSSVHRPYAQLTVAKDSLERTVAELDARNRELDALDDVAEALSGTLKPNEILESAIEKVMKVMQAGGGAIFLLEESTARWQLAAWRGLPTAVVKACRSSSWRPWEEPSASAGDSSQTLVPGGSGSLPGVGSVPARTASLGACSCAPIMSKGRMLGTIAMIGHGDRVFSLRDADLLTAVGYQLGLAIENAQLYEQTDERLREKVHELQKAERRSRFLSEVGALLGSGTELGAMLELVARKTTEVVGDWCTLYLLDDREKLLRLEAAHHADEEELRAIGGILRRRPTSVEEGLLGLVARTGEPVLAPRVSKGEVAEEVQQLAQSVEEIAILRQMAPTSRLAVPVRARGRNLGVLVIMNTHVRQPLDPSDLSLAMDLADRVGVAVENTRLFQESQAQRRHLEAIISQMADGVVVADELGGVSVVNAAAQRMLGHGMDRLLGGWGQLKGHVPKGSGRGRGANLALIPRALDGDLVLGESITVPVPGGERVLSASAGPLRNDAGEISGAVVVLRDVTAEREIERMKDEFVAVVSHELRTPITAVLGYTDILLRGLRGPLAPKQTEALGAVRSAAQRLLVLINDLLDMSRLEAGKQELLLAPVDLYAAADRALSAIAVLAATKGIHLVQSVPKSLPKVLADEEQLQRILGNLLSNAIKFTPEGGTVSVSAVPPALADASTLKLVGAADDEMPSVKVMVTDTGVGIPLDHQEKIWDKFQQVDSSSRRLFGGTGLGLAITRGLVELHGGRVWVESEGIPGRGSTFGFTLPVTDLVEQSE